MIVSNNAGTNYENLYFGNNPFMVTYINIARVLLEFDVLAGTNPACLELTVKTGGETSTRANRSFSLKQPTASNLPTPVNLQLKWSNSDLQTLISDSPVISTKNVNPAPVGGDKIYFDLMGASPVGGKYTLFLLADDSTRTDFSTSNDGANSAKHPKLLFGDDCPSS
jgi:hypothetical protein